MNIDFETIRIDINDHVAEVVLDRPEKLNAMSAKFFHEIRDAFSMLSREDNVRAIVVWAEGRLFTAGLDLSEAMGTIVGGGDGGRDGNGGAPSSEASRNLQLYDTIQDLQACFTTIRTCRKPVIAAIHGKCIGGGVDLVTACDVRLCTTDASFSIYETKIAIVADVGTLQRITPIVGEGMAREMALTGKFLPSDRSLQCGLVNQVYEDKAALLGATRDMAAEIAANSPLAVQGTKAVLNYTDGHSTAEGLEFVAQWNSSFLRSADLTEAMTAFMEKRDPKYTGS